MHLDEYVTLISRACVWGSAVYWETLLNLSEIQYWDFLSLYKKVHWFQLCLFLINSTNVVTYGMQDTMQSNSSFKEY